MPSPSTSRRRLIASLGGVTTLGSLAGCVADGGRGTGEPAGSPTSDTTTPAAATDPPETERPAAVVSVTVADFVVYPLSGTHPHVHRRTGTQYVVVAVTTSLSARALRDRLTLELDGDPVELASRQPVPWKAAATEVAFAVPKDATHGAGRVRFDGAVVHDLSADVVSRLNAPPVFEVGEASVSPTDVEAAEQTTAVVEFGLRNVGEGRGTFGASLTGNYVSGSATVTETLAPEAETTASVSTPVVGEGDAATVRLDWGADWRSFEIPVVGTTADDGTATPTPAPN